MSRAITNDDSLIFPESTVRPEYLKLPRDLAVLTRSFGIALSPQLTRDAAVLAFTIECADRWLDAIPQADGRARFSAAVLASFHGESDSPDELPKELITWLARLKTVAERHGVSGEFHAVIAGLLRNSERMRTTRRAGRFVACALREGRLMVELLLLLLGDVATPEFAGFMRRLSAPANLGDKLRDARRDFRRGEIAIRPTIAFHARLGWEMICRTAGLVGISAMNWRLAAWGMQSIVSEFIWFPFSKSHAH